MEVHHEDSQALKDIAQKGCALLVFNGLFMLLAMMCSIYLLLPGIISGKKILPFLFLSLPIIC